MEVAFIIGDKMTVFAILFIVFMVLWLVGGFAWSEDRSFKGIGGGLLPWICVAILGYMVINGIK